MVTTRFCFYFQMYTISLSFAVCFTLSFAKITEIPLPSDIQLCFEKAEQDKHMVGEVLFSRCVLRILSRRQSQPETKPLGDDAVKWISGLVDMHHLNELGIEVGVNSVNGKGAATRHKRQLTPLPRRQPRIRKEYRQLSEIERTLFHRAMNMLKADTVGILYNCSYEIIKSF